MEQRDAWGPPGRPGGTHVLPDNYAAASQATHERHRLIQKIETVERNHAEQRAQVEKLQALVAQRRQELDASVQRRQEEVQPALEAKVKDAVQRTEGHVELTK